MGEGPHPSLAALPAPRCPRYQSLDLWRGVACLLVVLHHATIYSTFWSGGERIPPENRANPASWFVAATAGMWVGVPIFFVISGYCIAATADATRRRPKPLSRYFRRRVRRIYPPYWAAVLVMILLVGVVDYRWLPGVWCDTWYRVARPWEITGWEWLGNLTLTETWRHYFVGGPPWYFHAMMWTLCYEEQFYLVIGLILGLSPRRLFAGAAVVTVLAVAVNQMLLSRGWRTDGFFFDGYWLPFAAGVLVYAEVNYAGPRGRLSARAVLAAGVALFAWLTWPVNAAHCHPAEATLVGLAFALVLSWLHPWDGTFQSTRALRPLFFCGTICYSLYLIHWPVTKAISNIVHRLGCRGDTAIVLLTVPLCVAASVLASWLFYRAVERRFLNPPQRAADGLEGGRAARVH